MDSRHEVPIILDLCKSQGQNVQTSDRTQYRLSKYQKLDVQPTITVNLPEQKTGKRSVCPRVSVSLPQILERFRQGLQLHLVVDVPGVAGEYAMVMISLGR